MARPRIWLSSPEERADRNTVVTLIEQVGREQLRFTVSDLRKCLNAHEQFSLHCSKDLSRHVAHLEEPGTLLVRVGARFDSGENGSAPARSKHTFVLTSRLAEFEAGHASLELDDVERVRLALWVAFQVCAQPVPTRAVTQVVRNILPLAVAANRQTSLFLQTLADRGQPLAEKLTVPGQRWVQWKPLGKEPELDVLQEWIREARPVLDTRATLTQAGCATRNELVREIVEIAVKAHSSPSWPAGRSVTLKDIRAAIHENARATYLHEHLKRIGGALGAVLGDMSKDDIVGRARVNQRVIKVPNPLGSSTYYDVPGLPGFESRRLVVAMRALASMLSAAALHELNVEYAEALALDKADDPALAAISTARLLHLQHELDLVGEYLQSTRAQAHLLSKAERGRLDEMTAKYDQVRAVRGTTAQALERATEALSPFGLTPEEVLAVDRPLLTGTEYAAWFSPAALQGRSPAEFLARARSLRRFPNPRHVNRADPDPVRAASTGVDRVDALVYAAQQHHTPLAGFLIGGAALLGRFLRDPQLPALLLDSEDERLRHQSLAALALLGDERAYAAARGALSDSSAGIRPTNAVYALMVLRRFTPDAVPAAVRRSADLGLLRTLSAAERAASVGRWLLQR